jgi:hypothetical protein
LTFTHTFTCDDDTVYFTHCFPYTYSYLQRSLSIFSWWASILFFAILLDRGTKKEGLLKFNFISLISS